MIVRVPRGRWLHQGALCFSFMYVGNEDCDDIPADLVLYRKHIFNRPVVSLRPAVRARRRVNELGRDPDPVAGAANTAFQNVMYPKLAPDLTDIDRLAL